MDTKGVDINICYTQLPREPSATFAGAVWYLNADVGASYNMYYAPLSTDDTTRASALAGTLVSMSNTFRMSDIGGVEIVKIEPIEK